MNKIVIVILVLGGAALALYFMGGNSGGVDLPDDVSVEGVEEALKEDGLRHVQGSCNVITRDSVCVDYIGSLWGDNDGGKLNCGDNGVYSENTCPYSDYGGCQTGSGTVAELVVWHYKEGGGEFNDENIQYARKACESTGAAKWVTPEVLLP